MFPLRLVLLASFVVLATRVVASQTKDLINIPIRKRLSPNFTGNVVQRDRMRLRFLLEDSQQPGSSNPNIPLNDDLFDYTIDVAVGDPGTRYQLIFDTGSSNFWVGANKSYVATKTSVKTNNSFNITYSNAQVKGTEYIDTVAIAPGIVIYHQSIGVASNFTNVSAADGILGFGPRDLTIRSLSPDNSSTIPTVMDNLVSQGTIEQKIFGVHFEASNSTSSKKLNNQLTIGGVDASKYIGDITYHNITKNYPANRYFGVDGSFKYGNKTIFGLASGIVDTGTSLIGLKTSAYESYVNATGAVLDNTTQLLRLPSADYCKLEPLIFTVDDTDYELNANAQILPRTFNTIIGGDPNYIYLIVFELGAESSVLNFILGMTFHQRYYAAYDQDNSRVGFASTRLTNATDIN